ncbi:hypothetical protein QJQ45_013319 [Haematococcus lacustris]|nr:hypothetical protein QJQ45_013319 [Haematococcus lacustris]
MQRNRQRKRNRDASDSEVDRELEAQPEPSQAQQAKQASGAARWDRHKSNSWHSKKCKLHFLMNPPAVVEAGPVLAPNVVEARLVPLIKAQAEACTMRALLGSVLFGLMVRRCFPAHIPAEVAIIPNLADRNLFLHLCRGLPPPGERARPSEAVEEVLAAYPALHARLRDVPRFSHDINTVDAVGNKLETSFANSLTELFTRRVEQAVALAGATLFAGSFEHRRRLGIFIQIFNENFGAVESVWQRTLTAGQYYRQSGITQHDKTSKVWMAGIGPQHDALSQVTTYTASLERYQLYVDAVLATWPAMWAEMSKPRWANARFRLYRHKQSTVAKFWAEVSWLDLGLWAVLAICGFERPGETVKGAMVRCNSAETGRPLALAYGAAGFSGSGTIGSKGVPVKQMLREACKHFPGRVVMVHEFRTSRVSSARNDDVQNEAEASRWLYPVRSMAKQSRIRGLMCSTSNVIKRRFYNRDVSAALNIRRIAAGPGRPRELSSWLGRPAMPNPGAAGQEWVHVRDKGLLRKWQRRRQRH